MIKIEFPSHRKDIARAMGEALTTLSNTEAKSGTFEVDVNTNFEEFQEKLIRRLADTTGLSYEQLTADPTSEEDIVIPDNTIATLQDAGSDGHGQFTKEETKEQDNLVDPANVDTKLVPFNAEFCGKAAKPFYASGKRAGQWKKRQGVDELVYDNWYAEQLANVAAASTTGQDEQTTVNTASAFGKSLVVDSAAEQQDAIPAAPHDAGTLMAWVSEMQAAGHITQQQVNDAYAQAGVTMTDVFPGPDKTVETIAQAVRSVHTILVSWT